MTRYYNLSWALLVTSLALLPAPGCAWQSGEQGHRPENKSPITPRRGTIVAEWCLLDSAQYDVVAGWGSAVANEVVLLCAQADANGAVTLAAGVKAEDLAQQRQTLQNRGLLVKLGLSFGGGPGSTLDPLAASKLLADSSWRSRVVQGLLAYSADGYEIAFPQLDNSSKEDLIAFQAELSSLARPAKTIGLFAPPSVTAPSDLPGGDAYDLVALRPYVDRVRLMTLDYSCCGAPPGPTIDPAWAAASAALAVGTIPERMIDVAIPLYGVHFSPSQLLYVSYGEALFLASVQQTEVLRTSTEVPHIFFLQEGQPHEVWFDDRASTIAYLRYWRPAIIPAEVGVVYYGLGSEDPGLWRAVAEDI